MSEILTSETFACNVPKKSGLHMIRKNTYTPTTKQMLTGKAPVQLYNTHSVVFIISICNDVKLIIPVVDVIFHSLLSGV